MRKVSIIVPVFNGEEYIEETIKSILNQNFQDFELIIIDDGSTDNTNNICKLLEKSDSKIKIIATKNQGVSSARN
ncbi:MAG: glycosyltransferase family A protein, partial [Lysinibacillus sp.]